MRASRTFASAVLLSAAMAAEPAGAGQSTTSFLVSATVASACLVVAAPLAFGAYSSGSATPLDTTSNIIVTCTPSLAYTVALDGGTTTGTVNARAMTSSGHSLTYALYTATARTTLWGDGTLTTQTVAGTGNGLPQTLTVYGRIPAAQFVSSGLYTDTVNVAVNY
jgi:spore coat protein U-like protein